MTGQELREYIDGCGMTVTEIARALDWDVQQITNKYRNKNISTSTLDKINSVVKGSSVDSVSDDMNLISRNEALQREVEILREQNKFLQNMLDRLTLPKTQAE